MALYAELGVGSTVSIVTEKLPRLAKYVPKPIQPQMVAKVTPPAPAAVAAPAPKLLAAAKPEPVSMMAKPAPAIAKPALVAPKLAAAARPVPAAVPPAAVTTPPPPVALAKASAPAPAKVPAPKVVAANSKPPSETKSVPAVSDRLVKADAVPASVYAANPVTPKKTETTALAFVVPGKAPAPIAAAPVSATSDRRMAAAKPKGKEPIRATISVDPERLAFLKTHEAALASTRAPDATSHGEEAGSSDLSDRLKGSILESGLSPGHLR